MRSFVYVLFGQSFFGLRGRLAGIVAIRLSHDAFCSLFLWLVPLVLLLKNSIFLRLQFRLLDSLYFLSSAQTERRDIGLHFFGVLRSSFKELADF